VPKQIGSCLRLITDLVTLLIGEQMNAILTSESEKQGASKEERGAALVLLHAKEALYHTCSVLAPMLTEHTEAGGVDVVGLGDLACK
jgi:hypothetical protein